MASLFMTISIRFSDLQKDFIKTLTSEQVGVYNTIMKERYTAYFIGTLLGVLAGGIFLYMSKDMDRMRRMCLFIVIVLSVQMLVYGIYPKSAWMLDNITNPESAQKWLDMYQYMKYKYMTGFILGLFAYMVFAYGFCY
jgi:hypothetical protein